MEKKTGLVDMCVRQRIEKRQARVKDVAKKGNDGGENGRTGIKRRERYKNK